ncbi:hypothetical protein ASD54_16850 [Rhizobium sp. Root149]|uniref:ATP-binding protein n=1 Tax=Rhizobium sp. Root149 TaxID=1736473 RepID=UPI00071414CF|nr:ATP-binding protein [Rhizobium sp. Root149]KQZ48533.1 hypothetical protein ASD54_16850 [Rhizobium sp. Root149]
MNSTDDDLAACAREPIHVPGAIQPHGALIVLDPDGWNIVRMSANSGDFLGCELSLGGRLPAHMNDLQQHLRAWHATPEFSLQYSCSTTKHIYTAHRAQQMVIVEAEALGDKPLDEVFSALRSFTRRLASESDITQSLNAVAQFVYEITGFDRALIYRFDPEWNGHVVAEAGNEMLPSYLGLRFPSSDIPAQARALYASNRLRIIPDASYTPVPILAADDALDAERLDMSFAQLRSVSPVHLEYMRNMGTGSSMSVSILVEGQLWGLISCHGVGAHNVPQAIRETCDMVAQSLAMRIEALDRAKIVARRLKLGQVTSALLRQMAEGADWSSDLVRDEQLLLSQVNAGGAVLYAGEASQLVGLCPSAVELKGLVEWLSQKSRDVVATNQLASEYAAAEAFAETASGILAIRLSTLRPDWLIWFRPELVRTVKWGGNPHKSVQESGRIHPRRSFDAWREQVRLQSSAWDEAEIEAAKNLRQAIVGIVLRKAEELAELSGELQRSNKELEAFSCSVSHDLRAPFRHIVGFAQLLRERETSLDDKSRHYLQTISDAAVSAGRLVDDLLNFSQLGRAPIMSKPVDMNKLVAEVMKSIQMDFGDRSIEWSVESLPQAWGDATLLRQVWYNLIENAVKYTRPRSPARISISGETEEHATRYSVCDNGVGFDMAYVGKLFGVFQRLQRAEDFDGTGIGLAFVRRIIEKHSGSITAEGEVDKGARFTFVLPSQGRKVRTLA